MKCVECLTQSKRVKILHIIAVPMPVVGKKRESIRATLIIRFIAIKQEIDPKAALGDHFISLH